MSQPTPKYRPQRGKSIASHCPLCKRQTYLTFHHFIPRKVHRRAHFKKNYSKSQLQEGVMICRQCHNGIHRFFDEMTLAKQFQTLADLQQDPDLAGYFSWVAKQRVAK